MDKKHQYLFSYLRQIAFAFTGGILAAYAIIRFGHLSNAQTQAMIELVLYLLKGSPKDVWLRIIGLLVYITGMVFSVVYPKTFHGNAKRLAPFINICCGVVLVLLPLDGDPYRMLYPVLFAAAFQWSAFQGVLGRNSATIFSTNNLKQFILSLTRYCYTRDPEELITAKVFGFTLLSFHLAVAFTYLSYCWMDYKSALMLVPFSLLALFFVFREEQHAGRNEIMP